jgi:hypothetical protein
MPAPALLLAATMFNLTGTHLTLLRHAVVMWSPVESGAPGVLVSPLQVDDEEGVSDATYADIAERAGLAKVDKGQIDQLLLEMPEALAQLLAHGELAPGRYRYDNPLADLPWTAHVLPKELASLARDKVVSFQFTERHAKLLRNARWWGMMMNPKRPYGDMTSFEQDMAGILGEPVDEQRLWKLHTETLAALQVFLQKAKLEPGEYPRIEGER